MQVALTVQAEQALEEIFDYIRWVSRALMRRASGAGSSPLGA